MATKVLSIEVGQGLTRIVEMDYKAKNPKIYNCFTFVTPKGVVNDGVVTCTDTFISLMKTECERWDVHTKKAVFSVTSRRIANREVTIPLIKDKQIMDMLNANAKDYFPIDMSQYHLSYKILSKVNTKEKKELNLKVLAVPNEVTDSYLTFAESCGLTLLALDFDGNSVFQAMEGVFTEGIHAVIKAEERTTSITIVVDGEIDFQRTLTYGIEGAIDVIRKNPGFGENLTYGESIHVLCGKTCIRRRLDDWTVREEEDTDEDVMEARIKVTQSLQGLIANVSRILEFYMDSNDIANIDHIHLIGLGGDFSGLSRLMSNELQQKVRVFRGMEGSAVEKTVRDDRFSVSSYIACVGAAMDPMNLLGKRPAKSALDMDLKDLKFDPVMVGGIVLAVGLLTSVGMATFSLVDYFSTQKKVETVQNHINDLEAAGVRSIYYEYITLEALSGELETIYASTFSRSEDLVEFIEELEDKMPSSITVMNFSANAQGVSMGITVNTKEEAAKTLLQLKSFESIEVVSTSGLTESTAENGETSVSFSVSLTYKPIDPEAELAEMNEEGTDEDADTEDDAADTDTEDTNAEDADAATNDEATDDAAAGVGNTDGQGADATTDTAGTEAE